MSGSESSNSSVQSEHPVQSNVLAPDRIDADIVVSANPVAENVIDPWLSIHFSAPQNKLFKESTYECEPGDKTNIRTSSLVLHKNLGYQFNKIKGKIRCAEDTPWSVYSNRVCHQIKKPVQILSVS